MDLPDYRADLCDRGHAVLNGSLKVEDALAGIHLSFGTGLWSDFYLQQIDTTGELVGFEVDLLNELSKRGSFTYNLTLIDSQVTDWRALVDCRRFYWGKMF